MADASWDQAHCLTIPKLVETRQSFVSETLLSAAAAGCTESSRDWRAAAARGTCRSSAARASTAETSRATEAGRAARAASSSAATALSRIGEGVCVGHGSFRKRDVSGGNRSDCRFGHRRTHSEIERESASERHDHGND